MNLSRNIPRNPSVPSIVVTCLRALQKIRGKNLLFFFTLPQMPPICASRHSTILYTVFFFFPIILIHFFLFLFIPYFPFLFFLYLLFLFFPYLPILFLSFFFLYPPFLSFPYLRILLIFSSLSYL